MLSKINVDKTKKPFFSVIVVSFNAEEYIGKTIKSALEQDFENFEIIVKDGLSTDKTLEEIPVDERIHIYSTADSGIYDAMNQAIDYASGEYVIFMNCGDTFKYNNVLSKVYNKIENDVENNGIIIGDSFSKGMYKVQNKCTDRFKQYRCSGFCHQAMFFSREVFEKIGVYDLSFKVYADFELFMRTYSNGVEIGYINYPICDYLDGGFSAKKETKRLLDEDKKRIREKYFSVWERVAFFIMFHSTVPFFRNWCESDKSPRYVKIIYRKIANVLNR